MSWAAGAPSTTDLARRIFENRYFTATIEIVRAGGTEMDADGDKRTIAPYVAASLPGRVVRGSEPRETQQAERVTTVATWEVRLSLSAMEKLRRERGCFEIKKSDQLRDVASGSVYEVIDDDDGRTEAERFLSVTTVKVG